MDLSKLDWKTILLSAAAVIIFNFIFMFLVISVYATAVATNLHTTPDQKTISDYANSSTAFAISVASLLIFAFLVSYHIAKKKNSQNHDPAIMSSLVAIFILVMDIGNKISISLGEILAIVLIFVFAGLGFYFGKRN